MSDFEPGDRVIYITNHVSSTRKDCERGTVSSKNDHLVFVKFDAQLEKFGWDETTAQGCNRQDLVLISRPR